MIVKRLTMMLAAVGVALAPVASANAASSLSLMGAAPLAGISFFQDEDLDDSRGGGSTAVILGVVLIVLIGVAAISGNGDGPDNTPSSP